MKTYQQLGSRSPGGVDIKWRDYAACRSADPDLFFPEGSGQAVEEIDAAKAICQTCRVRNACLQFALEANQECGIWGGTTEAERRRLRRAWLVERRRKAV